MNEKNGENETNGKIFKHESFAAAAELRKHLTSKVNSMEWKFSFLLLFFFHVIDFFLPSSVLATYSNNARSFYIYFYLFTLPFPFSSVCIYEITTTTVKFSIVCEIKTLPSFAQQIGIKFEYIFDATTRRNSSGSESFCVHSAILSRNNYDNPT